MKCGHCAHFNHTKYPSHAKVGLGVCDKGGFMDAGVPVESRMTVFRAWGSDLQCKLEQAMPAGKARVARRAWLTSLKED